MIHYRQMNANQYLDFISFKLIARNFELLRFDCADKITTKKPKLIIEAETDDYKVKVYGRITKGNLECEIRIIDLIDKQRLASFFLRPKGEVCPHKLLMCNVSQQEMDEDDWKEILSHFIFEMEKGNLPYAPVPKQED